MVPLTGIEPVRILLRGILSPLCLPIPPQRRIFIALLRSAGSAEQRGNSGIELRYSSTFLTARQE